jgi:hypothetical protein
MHVGTDKKELIGHVEHTNSVPPNRGNNKGDEYAAKNARELNNVHRSLVQGSAICTYEIISCDATIVLKVQLI